MIGVSAGEMLAALPFAAAAGGVAGIIYRGLGETIEVIDKVPKAIVLGIRGNIKHIKEYYNYYKSQRNSKCDVLKSVWDSLLIFISAIIFSLISYILLDGALRFEMLISFLGGFVALCTLSTKILSSVVRSIVVVFSILLVVVGKILYRILSLPYFLIKKTVKLGVLKRFFAKSDKK